MEVPIDTFATFIEQTTLHWAKHHCLLISLKILLKEPRKTKTLLLEKIVILQESENHLFGEKFRPHIIEIERSKKPSLEIFEGINGIKNYFFKRPSTLPE